MRIDEIASAEEQMALWRLVSNSVWTSINQQVRDEAARKAAAQRIAKPKGGRAKVKAVKTPLRLASSPPPPKVSPSVQSTQKNGGGQRQQAARVANPLPNVVGASSPSSLPYQQQQVGSAPNELNTSDTLQQTSPLKTRQMDRKTVVTAKSSAPAKKM